MDGRANECVIHTIRYCIYKYLYRLELRFFSLCFSSSRFSIFDMRLGRRLSYAEREGRYEIGERKRRRRKGRTDREA